MKIIKLSFYIELPFFICSLFAVLIKYTTRSGGFIDLSAALVFLSFVFLGVVLSFINALLFVRLKSKQILNRTWAHQTAHLIAYILLCVVSDVFIEPYHSYNLAFLMPIIIFIFILILNIILCILTRPENKEGAFDKISLIAFILLLCVSVVSTYHYYIEWDFCKKWAQVREIPSSINWERDFEAINFEISEGNIDRQYRVIRSKHADIVKNITMTERFYFDNMQQGKEIHKQLKKIYTNMKYYIFDLYEPSYNLDHKYCHKIVSLLSQEYGDVGYYYKLTEEFLNKTNPIIKDVTVGEIISYSKFEKILLDNNYRMTME